MQIGNLNLDTFCCGMIENNSYLLSDPSSGEAIIVDCPDGNKPVLEAIANRSLKLKYILLTHGHFDHCLGLDRAKQAYPDVPVYMHINDKVIFDNISSDLDSFGLTPVNVTTNPVFIEPKKTDLTLGAEPISLELTPGHTPGHLSLIWSGGICSGDVLFYRGIGRTDLFGGNEKVIYDTIRSQMFKLPEATVVFPGHGPSTTIGEEQKFNPFLGQFGRI